MALSGLSKIGIGALLKLSGRGYVDEMGKARDASNKFRKTIDLLPPGLRQVAIAAQNLDRNMKKMRGGINRIGSGIMDLGMGVLPLSMAFGAAAKQAADFEHGMKGVEAVTTFAVDQYEKLGELAQKIGIETQFDPAEATKLLEGMGRAGAKYEEIMGGAMGVANMAAAEQMDLSNAQKIVAQSARIMGLSLTKANKIADSYAKLSANANTNIAELGEAFKYAGPSARKAGLDFDTTLAFLAKLGDAGLRGSIGGTALQNMYNKITKRTEKATKALEAMNVSLVDQHEKWRPTTDVMADVVKGLSNITNDEERAALVSEIFGIRGERAFLAFSTQGKKSFDEMIEMSRNASEVFDKEGKKIGAATKMAQTRLDSFIGRVTLFSGSIKTFAVQAGKALNTVFKEEVDRALKSFNNFLRAFSVFEKRIGLFDGLRRLKKEFGSTAIEIVMGIKDGLNTIKNGINDLISAMRRAAKWLSATLGEEGSRKLTKYITIISAVAAAFGPIMVALWPLSMALKGIWGILMGIKMIAFAVAGSFWPITIIVLTLAGIFAALKRENESWLEMFLRFFETIKSAAMSFYEVAIAPLILGFRDMLGPEIENIGASFRSLGETVSEFFGTIFDNLSFTKEHGQSVFYILGAVIVRTLSLAIRFIAKTVKVVVELLDWLMTPFRFFLQITKYIAAALGTMFSGEVLKGFKRLGLAILDGILTPLRMVGRLMIKLAAAIGYELPKGLETFIEKGLTGLVYGEEDDAINERGEYDPSKARVAEKKKASQSQLNSMADIMARGKKNQTDAIVDGFGKVYGTTPLKVNANIDNKMCVDGEAINVASARSKTELKERMGLKATPWQYRASMEHGAEAV